MERLKITGLLINKSYIHRERYIHIHTHHTCAHAYVQITISTFINICRTKDSEQRRNSSPVGSAELSVRINETKETYEGAYALN